MITALNTRHADDRWNEVDFSDLLALLVLESHSLETYPQCSSLLRATMIAIWVEQPMNLGRDNVIMMQLARHREPISGILYEAPNVPGRHSQIAARRHTLQIEEVILVVERQ